MPVEVWPIVTVGGKDYYQVEGLTRIEVDPQGNVYYLIKTPDGGVGAVGPLVKGDPGKHTKFQTGPQDLTVLAYNDPAPASYEVIEVTPGSDTVSQVVKIATALHEGPPGPQGDTVLNPADFTDPLPGKGIVVNPANNGFVLQTPKVGDRHFPATIANIASGNATATLAQVSIPAQGFDWRPQVHASCEITGTGLDVKVDLIARLGTTGISNPETAGNVVGRGLGSAGLNSTPVMIPGPESGAAADVDKVLASNTAVIYLRAERQTGADYFTTLGSRTRFWVKVDPIP